MRFISYTKKDAYYEFVGEDNKKYLIPSADVILVGEGDSISVKNTASRATIGYLVKEQRIPLPQGYSEVEYIESTTLINNTLSTTRFNVQGDCTSGNSYTLVYELPSDAYTISNYYGWLFGNNAVCYQKLNNGYGTQKIAIKYFGKETATWPPQDVASGAVGTKIELVVSNDNAILTDVDASTSTTLDYTAAREYTTSDRFGLFCKYNVDDTSCAVGKIYEFKIEDANGNILNQYIPCLRDSDNKVGVYDIVNKAFYYDESEELTIVAGPLV